jgi:putative NIF3 family GTP cyclohydrolase 1 type 2
VPEVRIEMVAPRDVTAAVVEAARGVHPYEEPVVLAVEGSRARGIARLGRVCTWEQDAALGDLAEHVSRKLGVTCRVWGDRAMPVRHIAVCNGSGSSLLGDARRVADAVVLGEVRYHDALAAAASGLGIVEAGHDATEWPLVSLLEEAVREWDAEVRVTREDTTLGWWMTEGSDVRG